MKERQEAFISESFYFTNVKYYMCVKELSSQMFSCYIRDYDSIYNIYAYIMYVYIYTYMCTYTERENACELTVVLKLTCMDCTDVKIFFVLFILYETEKCYRSNIMSLLSPLFPFILSPLQN